MPALEATTRPDAATRTEEIGDFLRLASCPRCESRRRALVEVGGNLRGRCLACGEDLDVPLAVEHQDRLVLVGRAGQGIRRSETGD